MIGIQSKQKRVFFRTSLVWVKFHTSRKREVLLVFRVYVSHIRSHFFLFINIHNHKKTSLHTHTHTYIARHLLDVFFIINYSVSG